MLGRKVAKVRVKRPNAGALMLALFVMGVSMVCLDKFQASRLASLQFRWDFDYSNLLEHTSFADRLLNNAHDNNESELWERGADDWWIGRIPLDNSTPIVHQGAKHPNGSLGMVLNPSIGRLRRPTMKMVIQKFNSTCPDAHSKFGIEGEGGNSVLRKISRGLGKARWELQHNSSSRQPLRILCMIYTVYTEDDRHSGQEAIADTWGKECDGFFGASNLTDHSIGTIDLPHFGPEEYGNMWQKIRSMWTYAYDHYLDDYDYFYIAGDDVYALLDNMRFYLQGPEVKRLEEGYIDQISAYHAMRGTKETAQMRPRPLFFGKFMMHKGEPVTQGGPGYILNKAALQLWGEYGADSFRTTWQDPREDFFMANFFMSRGVVISETQDVAKGMRFEGSAQSMFQFRGMYPKAAAEWRAKYGFVIYPSIDLVSEFAIGFHLKYDKQRLKSMGLHFRDLIYRYHAFFNGWCVTDKLTHQAA